MKNLRGEELDKRLKEELQKMIETGYVLAPISRATLQRRLGLKSRGTLALGHRAEMIQAARRKQLNNAGVSEETKKRKSLREQNEELKEIIKSLEKERDGLIEKIGQLINGIQLRGYDIEDLMVEILG
ncbi:hypothetical protein [Flagellimonas sp.]|uniref:hypothetical protein n=1 Tax=Flagellimonas sp. TaxID=2058762 RepID=UPI003B51D5BE